MNATIQIAKPDFSAENEAAAQREVERKLEEIAVAVNRREAQAREAPRVRFDFD